MDLDLLQKKYEARFNKKHKRCSDPVIGITPRSRHVYTAGKFFRGMHKKCLKIGKIKGAV